MLGQSSLFAHGASAVGNNSPSNNKAETKAVPSSFSEQYDTIGFKLIEIEQKYGRNHAVCAALHAIDSICSYEKQAFRQINNPNKMPWTKLFLFVATIHWHEIKNKFIVLKWFIFYHKQFCFLFQRLFALHCDQLISKLKKGVFILRSNIWTWIDFQPQLPNVFGSKEMHSFA